MDASPTKRRALAPLSINSNSPTAAGLNNKLSPSSSRLSAAKASVQLHVYSKATSVKGGSPSPSSKRALAIEGGDDKNFHPLQQAGTPPAKRACIQAATATSFSASTTASSSPQPRRAAAATTPVKTTKLVSVPTVSPDTATTTASREEEETAITAADQERQRSHSPEETSAIFDSSAPNNSQLTTITEPDDRSRREVSPMAAAASFSTQTSPSSHQSPRLTREQARQKAEILRLRLGLARYKVRTGQTDVPLERLQRRSVLPSTSPQSQSPSQQQQQQARAAAVRVTPSSSPFSAMKEQQQRPIPAQQRRLSREENCEQQQQQQTTPRKALPSGRSVLLQTSQDGFVPLAAQESRRSSMTTSPTPTSQQQSQEPQYAASAPSTPDREALQRLAASAALDASRRIEEAAAEISRWS